MQWLIKFFGDELCKYRVSSRRQGCKADEIRDLVLFNNFLDTLLNFLIYSLYLFGGNEALAGNTDVYSTADIQTRCSRIRYGRWRRLLISHWFHKQCFTLLA